MPTLRIASTRAQDLQPLAAGGQSGLEAWGTLHALLTDTLSAAHAALLSEPVPNDAQGTIDWYADSDGTPVRLEDLAGGAREAALRVLDGQIGDIEALAARLGASRAEGDRFLGDMLGMAVRVPGLEFVWVCGGQPVLVAWAHGRSGGQSNSVLLSGLARAAARPGVSILPPPPSPYEAAPAPRRWLWGALGASLLVALLALFMVARDPYGWLSVDVPQCRIAPGQLALEQGLAESVAREGVLRAELSRLTAGAGQRRLMCPPTPTPAALPIPPARPAQPVSPAPSEDARRAERRGGQAGKLQVILAWDDVNDLDLRVVCPSGEDITYLRRQACGGRLDVDANGDVDQLTTSPVENIYFTDPQPGRYRVIVDPYGMRRRQSSAFRVTIRREGQPDEVITGVAQNGQRERTVATFVLEAQP